MPDVSLKEYLGHVLEAEKSVLVLAAVVEEQKDHLSDLVRGQQRSVSDEWHYERIKFSLGDVVPKTLGVAGIGAGVGFIVAWIRAVIAADEYADGGIVRFVLTLWHLLTRFFSTFIHGWPTIGIFAGIGAGLGLVIGLVMEIMAVSGQDAYEAKLREEHAKALVEDRARVSEVQQAQRSVKSFLENTQQTLSKTRALLTGLYGMNLLHPSYRNIVAVASFYQYVDTGICNTLEGPDGAYKLFMQESWFKTLTSKLDCILDSLEDIKANQYVLLDAIKSTNRQIKRLTQVAEVTMDYAGATAQNSRIIAYNTHVSAVNTGALMWMKVLGY